MLRYTNLARKGLLATGDFYCLDDSAMAHDTYPTQARLSFPQAGLLGNAQVALYAQVVAKKSGSTTKRHRAESAFSARVKRIMALRGMKQADLLRRIHEIAAGDEFAALREKSFSQQMLNAAENQASQRSFYAPIIAAALGVSSVWLQWGIGHPNDEYIQALPDWSEPVKSMTVPRGRRLAGSKSG